MPEAGESELLFFDTFSHENTEELNLDLVQFPRPVLIHEVRVVPLGTKVQADVPGGSRLGATNPSSFKLDLFVNNLAKPNAATFEKLGVLDYKGNDNIQLPLDVAVPTDGLIIKGWYSVITLAVYGCPTTVTKDRASPPPPPPPRSKTQGDCLMVIPPAVVDNVQQPSQQSPINSNNTQQKEWESTSKPVVPSAELNFPSATQPAPVVTPSNTTAPPLSQPTPEMFHPHDIDERFSQNNPQLSTQQTTSSSAAPQERNPLKDAPQVELGEHGEADEIFEAYLREKDRKREEKERVRAEREKERADRSRKESRSRTPETRGHSKGQTRSSSRSRSRSTDRDYRKPSREREYRDSTTRDSYRERERDRYCDRGAGRERGDSRDRRESREKEVVKEKQELRDKEHKRQGSQERQLSRERPRERDNRRDSTERTRDKTPDRSKSPKTRTPRRSRSQTPPARKSRSRSRERTYERDRSGDYREKERERDKDYDKTRDKERDLYRDRDKDYERDYKGRDVRDREAREYEAREGRDRDMRDGRDRDMREYEGRERRDRDGRDYDAREGRDGKIRMDYDARDMRIGDRDRENKDRDTRESWPRGDNRRVVMEGDRSWDKTRDNKDVRDQQPPFNDGGEWHRPREQQPPPNVLPIREHPHPSMQQVSHDQRHWNNPPINENVQPHWNRDETPPVDSSVPNQLPGPNQLPPWGQNDNFVVQDNWGRSAVGRIDDMSGTWAPPPQSSQQPQSQFPVIPEEPIPPNNAVVVLPMTEEMELGDGYNIQGGVMGMEGDEIYTPLSDGEIEEEPAYSDISSDENFLESLNDEEYQQRLAELQQSMEDIEDPWSYAISSFNPYQCELSPLETFDNPSLTEYELEKQKLSSERAQTPDEAGDIQSTIIKFKETAHNEEWVEAMESLIPKFSVGLSFLMTKSENQGILDSLITNTLEGLNLEQAKQQPLAAYKVRHIKMGVRMAGALCACDSIVASGLLEAEIQHKLIDLYEAPHMSSSIKLYIIKALDSTLKLKDGLEWFLGKHPKQLAHKKPENPENQASKMMTNGVINIQPQVGKESEKYDLSPPYKRYLQMMVTKQMTRLMVALTALLRKVHLYDLLHKLTTVVEMLAENTTFPDSTNKPVLPVSNESEVDIDMDSLEPEMPLIPDNMTAEDIENLISCLQEVTKVVLNEDYILGQPAKIMPNRTVFQRTKKPVGATQAMYRIFSSKQLLEGIFVLLSSPATFHHNGVFNAIKDLLTCLISTQPGLLYMCSRFETVNGIIRALTQTTGYSEDDEEGSPRGPHPAHLLGLQLIYYLQTLQNIDRLKEYHAKDDNEKDIDDADPLGLLHCLYMMTFTPQGRDAVVHVFTMKDNLSALLPFIDLPGEEVTDIRIKRSVCHSYTVLLLLLIVRHSENVEYLEKYATQLLNFTQQEPASNKTFDKVTELQDWLAPLKKVSIFSYEPVNISELVKLLKQYSEEINDLPKGLVTTVRILKHFSVEPEKPVQGYDEQEGPLEKKYSYAVMEIFSADSIPLFRDILQKIGDLLTRPLQQTLPKMGMPKMVIQYIVSPVLSLVKHILQKLISIRGPAFTDLSLMLCMFQLHTVMCSVSHSGTLSSEAQNIQNTIVDILMTYTQPALNIQQQTEDALSKSLWTMMFKELLKYVVTAPYTFLSGLILTSELLPLPLPIQTKEPMTEEEVNVAVNQRKLWSAHLHPLSDQIQDILRNLSGSACQPLQQLLRRVCWQLADLAGPSALMVVRCLLETVTESMDVSIEKHMTDVIRAIPPGERPLVEVRSSGETAKILNLLAFLMNQPPVKVAFIHLSSGKSRLSGDEKHGTVLLRLARLLNVIDPESTSHMQAQESIVSIFQSLCDLEVTMIPPENNMIFTDQLANSLPPRDQMAIVCEALLVHLDQRDHNFSSILPALRTLALLMLHDFGFYHVKIALEKVPRAFFNLFLQINNTFSKDSSDCIATLSSAIELLQFLVALPEAPEGEEQTVPFERTYLISYKDLREVLKWNKDPAAGHPLSDLDSLLHEYAKEEETLRAVYESVNLVVSILKSDEDQSKPDMEEPMLPDPEGMQAQFDMRSIYLITDDEDDRLSATYWLATPMGEDTDDKDETVTADFEEMAHKYCQDFDLAAEIEKGAVQSDPPIIKRRRSRIGRRLDIINTSKMRGKSGKFVAPMRGRGIGRVMPINKNDMFRSRPQNTSRPPSMHVDDFIKMELQGGGAPTQIGPTGMNPHLTKFREQVDSFRGRGGFQHRGRGRGNSRGRFFSPPGSNYIRRDNTSPNTSWGGGSNNFGNSPIPNRGGYRGGRGSATVGINTRGSPPKPPQSSWGNRPPRQEFGQGFYRGSSSGEWGGQRSDRGGGRGFTRGWGGGGGGWRGKDERRFMPPPGTPPFYGRREPRPHQRSFTK